MFFLNRLQSKCAISIITKYIFTHGPQLTYSYYVSKSNVWAVEGKLEKNSRMDCNWFGEWFFEWI